MNLRSLGFEPRACVSSPLYSGQDPGGLDTIHSCSDSLSTHHPLKSPLMEAKRLSAWIKRIFKGGESKKSKVVLSEGTVAPRADQPTRLLGRLTGSVWTQGYVGREGPNCRVCALRPWFDTDPAG